MSLANRFRYLVDIERPLRNENRIGTACDSAVQRDPACIPPHDLDDHDAVVRLGRSMHAVNRFAHNVASRIESERVVGAPQVIVDRFRNANYVHTLFMQFLGDRQRVIASNGDQSIDLVSLDGADATIKSVRTLGRIRSRRPQNGSTTWQDPAYGIKIQRHALVLDQSAPALQESDELVVVVKNSLANHSANHRIQSGTIAPAR